MGLRKTKDERDLAALTAKVEAARSDLEARRVAEREAESEHRQTLDSLAGDLGLGDIDEAAYERAKVEADSVLARVRYERDRAEAVERAVSVRAADLSETIENAKVDAAQEDLQRGETAVEEAAALLGQRQVEREAAEERLALAQRRAGIARAPFDVDAAQEADRLAEKDANWATWYVRSAPRDTPVPPERREAVEAARAALEAEDAAYKERMRTHPARVEPGNDGLREGDGFPTVEPIGPARG